MSFGMMAYLCYSSRLAELKLKAEENSVNVQRRQKVKEVMLHAWTSYEKYVLGQDELRVGLPQSKDGVNSFGGLGATLILCNYEAAKVGFGAGKNMKTSIAWAVYDCPFVDGVIKVKRHAKALRENGCLTKNDTKTSKRFVGWPSHAFTSFRRNTSIGINSLITQINLIIVSLLIKMFDYGIYECESHLEMHAHADGEVDRDLERTNKVKTQNFQLGNSVISSIMAFAQGGNYSGKYAQRQLTPGLVLMQSSKREVAELYRSEKSFVVEVQHALFGLHYTALVALERWDDAIHEDLIREAYDTHAGTRYTALTHKLKKNRGQPNFVTDEAWRRYLEYWESEDFLARSR
ncbi:hypothetical protein Syun_030022 [Stephania yunnanensis]|uniref:Uncharacterized protein n=1 Tax=Stephania yunnanensis TaxID=152371 RepID=A0AAP0HGK5_9MAGN